LLEVHLQTVEKKAPANPKTDFFSWWLDFSYCWQVKPPGWFVRGWHSRLVLHKLGITTRVAPWLCWSCFEMIQQPEKFAKDWYQPKTGVWIRALERRLVLGPP